ncbi:AAA family ATPase [Parasedimentitalea maritima]|uniref:AAA family ATPase n=1 Tax=Parasedimentitalea maritima TaxID=2578117 RepID=A0A6A4RES3_9RHOB|nr:AAA family ATPase [Zongyanglinia marina]KAE9627827.1 AAA family ATPase [Zongyanglinia marina]
MMVESVKVLQTPTFFEAAMVLIEQGFHVFPCRTNKQPYPPNGHHSATQDREEIRIWSEDHPDAQPAIACAQSDIVVIDVDDLTAWENHLAEHGLSAPATLCATTPSGGRHYYFRVGADRNFAGRLCPGVDIKYNGYVLAPPAQAYSKRAECNGHYSWHDATTPIATAPNWPALYKVSDVSLKTSAGANPRSNHSTADEVEELLSYLDPDADYNIWLPIIMDIHEATGGSDEGMRIADAWSSRGGKYKPKDVTSRWPGFTLGKTAGMPALASRAKACGADVGAIWKRHNATAIRVAVTTDADKKWFASLDLTNVVPFRGSEYEEAILRLEMDEGIDVEAEASIAVPALSEPVQLRLNALAASVIQASKAEPILNTDYLIKGWLGAGGASMLFGPSNVGKSFVALNIANHVANGEEWNGCKMKGGLVFYFAAEGGRAMQNRLVALQGGASDNLLLVAEPIDLYSTQVDVQAIVHLIKAHEASHGLPALVVFDTLARAMAGGDENTGPDIALVMRHVDAIRTHTGAHVMLVHHTGKDLERGARGHSSLRAAIDTEIQVKVENGGKCIKATKQRDMETGGQLGFELVSVEIGEDEDGDMKTSCYVEFIDASAYSGKAKPSGKNQIAVFAELKAYLTKHGKMLSPTVDEKVSEVMAVTREDFVPYAQERRKGSTEKAKRRAVKEALEKLEENNLVTTDGINIWLN